MVKMIKLPPQNYLGEKEEEGLDIIQKKLSGAAERCKLL